MQVAKTKAAFNVTGLKCKLLLFIDNGFTWLVELIHRRTPGLPCCTSCKRTFINRPKPEPYF